MVSRYYAKLPSTIWYIFWRDVWVWKIPARPLHGRKKQPYSKKKDKTAPQDLKAVLMWGTFYHNIETFIRAAFTGGFVTSLLIVVHQTKKACHVNDNLRWLFVFRTWIFFLPFLTALKRKMLWKLFSEELEELLIVYVYSLKRSFTLRETHSGKSNYDSNCR